MVLLWKFGVHIVQVCVLYSRFYGNWTFFAKCYGWGATGEYRLKIGDFAPTWAGWPKISRRRGRPHHPFFFSENLAKSSFVWYINDKSGQIFLQFCHNSRVWRTDGRTNGRTEFSSLHGMQTWVCIPCSVVKMNNGWSKGGVA